MLYVGNFKLRCVNSHSLFVIDDCISVLGLPSNCVYQPNQKPDRYFSPLVSLPLCVCVDLQALREVGQEFEVLCLAFSPTNLSSSPSDTLFLRVFGRPPSLSLVTNPYYLSCRPLTQVLQAQL